MELFLIIVDKLCVLHCFNLHFLQAGTSQTRIHKKGTVLKSDTVKKKKKKINERKFSEWMDYNAPVRNPSNPPYLKEGIKAVRCNLESKGRGTNGQIELCET